MSSLEFCFEFVRTSDWGVLAEVCLKFIRSDWGVSLEFCFHFVRGEWGHLASIPFYFSVSSKRLGCPRLNFIFSPFGSRGCSCYSFVFGLF